MHLFSPLTIRDITFRNRIVVSPMCQYSCVDGLATDWHLVHLGSRAVGGTALVFAEATAVTADGRISPMDLGIWSDAHIEPLARAAKFIKAQGAVAGIQLAHAGRKASTNAPWLGGKPLSVDQGGWTPIFSASAISFNDGYQIPVALNAAQIAGVAAAFADAARRALEAGFEVVELHGAHGYLGNQFLSPLSNHRTDEYGGSLENRTRFLREMIQAVRKVWPRRLPLFLRISATDWMEGGWTGEESIALARIVKALGVDLVDCSSGGTSPLAKIPLGAGYQVPFASAVRRHANIATGAVGMITEPMQADQIIRNEEADLVIMAREFLRDPYWPIHAAATLHHEINWPLQYERAKPVRK